jgi:hypothetical protein
VNITNSTLSDNDGSVQNTGTGSVNIANSSFSFDKGAVKNTGAERRPHAACAVNFTILLAVTVVPPTLALDEIAACVESLPTTAIAQTVVSTYLRTLAIKEKLRGREHPDVVTTLNDLAVFYKSQ